MNEWTNTMSENEIAEVYNISANEFAEYLKYKNLPHDVSIFNGVAVPKHLVDEYVRGFLEDKYLREQEHNARVARETELRRQEDEEMRRKLETRDASMKASADYPITTDHCVPGYNVIRHVDILSVSNTIQVPRGGITPAELNRAINRARKDALLDLRIDAHEAGGNAVTGVQLSYTTIKPETINSFNGTLVHEPHLITVNATANAVVIEAE